MCTCDNGFLFPRNAMRGLGGAVRGLGRIAQSVHRDERGAISILTVFAIFMFTILMGMVINVGRHVDDKLRMQNAADAAAYSGGVVLARGMNTLAFTNHLEAEIFALTAYMREPVRGEEGMASLVPEILAEWRKSGRVFENSADEIVRQNSPVLLKFKHLGQAIQRKLDPAENLEQAVVDAYVEMSAEHARMTLPVLERILEGELIPRFQRAVVRSTPTMAHLAANEMAERYGSQVVDQHGGVPLQCRLWRTDVQSLGNADESNWQTRTLPVGDPSPVRGDFGFGDSTLPPGMRQGTAETFLELARQQRRTLAEHYLEQWIRHWMGPYFDFDYDGEREGTSTAKMSNLINLWRSATCAHLDQLLEEEYPDTNLPHVIRDQPTENRDLERTYAFVAVAYWPHLQETLPGLFKNLLESDARSDALAFAQVTVYLPERRYRKINGNWGRWIRVVSPEGEVEREFHPYRDNWPQHWDALNQNWMARLVPATSPSLVQILQTRPPGLPFQPPDLGAAESRDIDKVNFH